MIESNSNPTPLLIAQYTEKEGMSCLEARTFSIPPVLHTV
jgi:hypothetical protein